MRLLLQFDIAVSDQSNPPRVISQTCSFDVTRDTVPPIFQRTPYVRSISENLAVGSSVEVITASDNDIRGEIVYGLANNYLSNNYQAAYYFSLETDTGIVRVRNNLRQQDTTQSTYLVCI